MLVLYHSYACIFRTRGNGFKFDRRSLSSSLYVVGGCHSAQQLFSVGGDVVLV